MPDARITTHAVLTTALAYAATPAARRAVWDRTDPAVTRAASVAFLSDARHGAYGPAYAAELRGWATSARAAVKRLDAAPVADEDDATGTDDDAAWSEHDAACRADGCLSDAMRYRHTDACEARRSALLGLDALGFPLVADEDDVTALADAAGVLTPADVHAPLTLAGRPFRAPETWPLLMLTTPVVTCAPADEPVPADAHLLSPWDVAPADPDHDEGAPTPDAPLVPEHDDMAGLRPVVGLVATLVALVVVLVALGFGDPGSRATLGLPVAVTPVVSASAPFADRDATREEDSPRWDCYADGNRLCAPFHGPTR